MGGDSHSSSITRTYIEERTSSGRSLMDYSESVSRGEVEAGKVHPKLDPKRLNSVTNTVMRDSRDSELQPVSTAIAVIFDDTGSMLDLPEKFVRALPDLMDVLIKHNYITGPQILFGAVNDATTYPAAAIQIGQFESGNQMDEVLTHIMLQGGGGSGSTESYELAMYYMARHTALDCFEKRGKKGYLFITGDEVPFANVKPAEVEKWIGDKLQAPIPVADILAELKEKYEVFWLFPAGSSNYSNTCVRSTLQGLFGQNFIELKQASDISMTIAAIIGINEGRDASVVKTELAGTDTHAAEVQLIVDSIPPRRLDEL